MGGYGSGYWRDRNASRCEGMYRIELAFLREHQLLKPNTAGKLSWTCRDRPSGSIDYRMHADHMELNFRTRSGEADNWTPVRQRVNFDWTDTAFGGERRWFLCPSCDRRCSVLYGASRYACRQCHRLVYESQYEDAMQSGLTRALDIKAAMGDPTGIDDGFPPKPKGMHLRTYQALEKQYSEAQTLFGILAARMMLRITARTEGITI